MVPSVPRREPLIVHRRSIPAVDHNIAILTKHKTHAASVRAGAGRRWALGSEVVVEGLD